MKDMGRNRIILTMCVLALLAVGCKSARKVVANEPPRVADTVAVATPSPQAPQNVRELSVTKFTADVEGNRVNGQLRMAEDSVIWICVYKVIELGRAKATADSVWVNVPLLNRSFAGTYAQVSRMAKREVTFEKLMAIVNSDDAERQIEALAATLGYKASVTLERRQKVQRLSFPFSRQ